MTRFFVAALLGCGAQSTPETVTMTSPSSTPQPHVAPPSSVQPFLDAGCTESRGELDCAKARIDGVDACRFGLRKLDVKLDPPALVAMCHADPQKVPNGLHTSGCKLTSSVIVFAATNKGIARITSAKELAAAFAPVTTADEAIAFAELETGDDRMEKVGRTDSGKPMQTVPIPSGGGWRFDLFRYQSCGCDHPVDAMTYSVERDGTVTLVSRAPARANAEQSGMCKD